MRMARGLALHSRTAEAYKSCVAASISRHAAATLPPIPLRRRLYGFGSIYGMQPGSPFLEALAATPVAPGITSHSIIPVKGAGAGAAIGTPASNR
mgnify:CR=1 FL=1